MFVKADHSHVGAAGHELCDISGVVNAADVNEEAARVEAG